MRPTRHHSLRGFPRGFAAVLLLASTFGPACGWRSSSDSGAEARVKATYGKTSGKLELLTYDSNKDGRTDIWSYMDGTRVLRIEVDTNFDGVIDRWEYYSADGKLEKVGFSRAHDGKVDAWAYQGADGLIARAEVATRRDDKVNRWEYYEKGVMVRSEEDTDGNGTVDKWETYRDGALSSLTLDIDGDGKPDRRLVYGPDGVKVEKLTDRTR